MNIGDLVGRDEFEQAMEALGLEKLCWECEKPINDFQNEEPMHRGEPCRGYGYPVKILWRKKP